MGRAVRRGSGFGKPALTHQEVTHQGGGLQEVNFCGEGQYKAPKKGLKGKRTPRKKIRRAGSDLGEDEQRTRLKG